jgi:hypothetical protein
MPRLQWQAPKLWSGVGPDPTTELENTPKWQWRPRGELTAPLSSRGKDEYDTDLVGHRVTATLDKIDAYLGRVAVG